jgi:hypothetical protein
MDLTILPDMIHFIGELIGFQATYLALVDCGTAQDPEQ